MTGKPWTYAANRCAAPAGATDLLGLGPRWGNMIEVEIDIKTASGAMNTFVVYPEEGPPRPVVLFLMDAPGMREELRDMCRRLASAGYFVLAPNLYYRYTRQYNVFETQDRDRMFELMGNLTNAMVVDDAQDLLAWAETTGSADTSAVGTVGYCMSGPFTIMIAAALPAVVKAAASIHGVSLAVEAPDSPHRHLDQTMAELYVACAEIDEYAPPEMVELFTEALESSTAIGRVEWYPGTEHGFAFAERPLYHQASSERHWERLHSLFSRTLAAG